MTEPAIALRLDLIDGNFELPNETTEYMRLVRRETAKLAKLLNEKRPADFDAGRFIASLDKLQEFKDTLCVSVIIGAEGKRRRTAVEAERAALAEAILTPDERRLWKDKEPQILAAVAPKE